MVREKVAGRGWVAHSVRATPAYFFARLPVTEQRLVLTRGTHRPDRVTDVAGDTPHIRLCVPSEIEAPGVARVVIQIACSERTRPVVAVARIERTPRTEASDRQEDHIAVRPRETPPVHAVLCCTFISAVIVQLLPFFLCRSAGSTAPIGRGRIIARLKDGQVVGIAVAAEIGIVTVFCQ